MIQSLLLLNGGLLLQMLQTPSMVLMLGLHLMRRRDLKIELRISRDGALLLRDIDPIGRRNIVVHVGGRWIVGSVSLSNESLLLLL